MSTQMTAEQVMEMLNNNRKSRTGTRARPHVTYTRHVPADLGDVRLPPQAIVLVGALLSADVDTWTEPELQEIVQNCSEDLKTKQEPWKIFQYYRTALIDAGFLSMKKGASE